MVSKKVFYTIQEVAEFLYITKQTLHNKINKNRRQQGTYEIPPYIKHGGKLLFPVKEFHKWLSEQPLITSNHEMEK